MPRLVLFDIDGTLLTDRGASRDAFAVALDEVFGYRGDLGRYDFSGRTDPQIAHMVLRDVGWEGPTIEDRMSPLWDIYLAGLAKNATCDRVRSLPGIVELLAVLRSHPDVILAILTGNIEPGARLKLGGAGLGGDFPFGAFGSDSADRLELPPIALQRATDRTGAPFPWEDVVIIGDSIYDVRCGKPWGATTIALASGKTPADALRAENPSHFFESAEDTEAVARAIVGTG